MLAAPPLDSIYAGEFEPGADKTTDADIEEWLRGVVASDNHEVGSLSMMPQGLGGVVDTSLKVYGTANVRVAGETVVMMANANLKLTHLLKTHRLFRSP
jgi:choline dehydrogenase-like flavoprotein